MVFEMKIDSKAFTFDQIQAFAVRKLCFNGIDEGTWMVVASILYVMIVTKRHLNHTVYVYTWIAPS